MARAGISAGKDARGSTGANHLLHSPIPKGSLLEIAPTKVELAKVDDEQGGYVIVVTDEHITVRVVMPADDYVTMIRSAGEQLDSLGAPSGKLLTVPSLHAAGLNGTT